MALRARLSRYRDFARFVAKYGRAEFVTGADPGSDCDPRGDAAEALAFAADLEKLGPTFIKLGQLLSTRADLLPPAYLEALARLQDNVDPFPFDDVERIVQDELGVRLSKAFQTFDPTPIAAASLGQVHRAVMRDGREVAVKVQRPNVHDQVVKDLDALDEVAALMQRFSATTRAVGATGVLEEFRRTILLELDYREESRNLLTLSHQLRDFDRIVIPLPIDDFTTARVLTMDYIEGPKITAVSPVEWTEVDGVALGDDLFRAYLQQILIDGLFHADPHPGNVLLTPDHRLALIDLGMVGRLSWTMQERLFRLLLAISEARGDDAASVIITTADQHDDFDETQMRRTIVDLVGRYRNAAAKELNVGRVMLQLAHAATQHGLRMPPELALLGKTLLNLDEIGRRLDPDFDVNASMRRNATRLMQRRMLNSMTPANVFSTALEVRDFAERLPARMNRILDALAANDLRLKIEVIDHGSIIDGFQKVANRIALGLVLAALVIGAAMLMRVQTPFTILGYPGLAMLLFLAAAGGGFWMAWTILAGDVRTRKKA
ncbi:MAG TPA: AarF/UbiB family protein [Vicinamibacterales bacterium]|jgi:predicted unusual protein kinase regulating ubiquinone biosynthesis (AarF/ABC1/UbiB family)|nr:AarF/UbiB family protein [Vicinamibacterales bacterium]